MKQLATRLGGKAAKLLVIRKGAQDKPEPVLPQSEQHRYGSIPHHERDQ